jgi:methylmalonyl-CoA mutase N-terminal domain/subunit
VQPATKGKSWLGENGEGERIKNRTVMEEDKSRFKKLRKSRKRHKAMQALQNKRHAAVRASGQQGPGGQGEVAHGPRFHAAS